MEQRSAPEPRDDGADPIKANIAAVARLERATSRARTHGLRLAGAVTRLAGSAPSILFHALWFVGWILVNRGFLGARPFDPFPFSLLTMIVSLEVIFLTLFVLLNQNHMATQARKRAHLEFQVTLLAEREMTLVLKMLKELSAQLGVTSATARELEVLLKDTDVGSLSAKLDAVLEDE
jgi:uncharacterized membrane protein